MNILYVMCRDDGNVDAEGEEFDAGYNKAGELNMSLYNIRWHMNKQSANPVHIITLLRYCMQGWGMMGIGMLWCVLINEFTFVLYLRNDNGGDAAWRDSSDEDSGVGEDNMLLQKQKLWHMFARFSRPTPRYRLTS